MLGAVVTHVIHPRMGDARGRHQHLGSRRLARTQGPSWNRRSDQALRYCLSWRPSRSLSLGRRAAKRTAANRDPAVFAGLERLASLRSSTSQHSFGVVLNCRLQLQRPVLKTAVESKSLRHCGHGISQNWRSSGGAMNSRELERHRMLRSDCPTAPGNRCRTLRFGSRLRAVGAAAQLRTSHRFRVNSDSTRPQEGRRHRLCGLRSRA